MAERELFPLIASHLPEGRLPTEEFIAFRALPGGKAQEVERRLRALDRCVGHGAGLAREVIEAAATLQCSERQVYKLLARLREFGPVKGLAPGAYRTERPRVARDGLGDAAEDVLTSKLKENPRASQASLEMAVAARCAELGLTPPTQYSVRQRVLQLRATGQMRLSSIFGSRLVLDQTSINIFVNVGEGISLPSIATLLLDEGLGLILGGGLTNDPLSHDLGMLIAAINANSAVVPMLRQYDLQVATGLGLLTWVVPPALERQAHLAGTVGRSSGNKADLKVVSNGPKRHGSEILRIIGDRLGPFVLHPRQSFSDDLTIIKDPGVDIEEARKLLDLAIGSWNRRRLERLGIAQAKNTPVKARRLSRILGELSELLEPVHAAVVAEQSEARDRLEPGAPAPAHF